MSVSHTPLSMDNGSVTSENYGNHNHSSRSAKDGVTSINSGASSRNDLSPASDGIARQLKHLESQSKNSQQTIIEVHRALDEEKKNLRASKKRLELSLIHI